MSKLLDEALLTGFLEAARAGSLGAAAKNLRRSQPLLTNHIRRLEDVVGCQLFERSPRGVSLTPEGYEFLPFATRIMALSDEAARRVGRPAGRRPGQIRIRLSEDLVGEQVMKSLLSSAPRPGSLDIEVMQAGEEPSPRDFETGEVDMFFGDPSPTLSAALPACRVVKTRLIWAASAKFSVRARPLPLALDPNVCSWRARIAEVLDRQLIDWFVAVETGSLSALQSAARSELALIACLAPSLCEGLVPLDHRDHGLPEPPEVEIAQYRRAAERHGAEMEALESRIWSLITGPGG
jgi:DNA-binding transcriptional LysR family regulator